MRERESATRRLMRIERAVGIERKELKLHLERLEYMKSAVGNLQIANIIEERGRGGHPVIAYDISENGEPCDQM